MKLQVNPPSSTNPYLYLFVNFFLSSSVSSPSLHSPSSPTANIVSPSNDPLGFGGLGGALLLFCSAGAGDAFLGVDMLAPSVSDVEAPPVGLTARSWSFLEVAASSSSSESESAMLRISKPSSSWDNYCNALVASFPTG